MTTAVQPEGANVETGEIVALPAKFEIAKYLDQVGGSPAFTIQQRLAAAYDAACAALIGPNDVQEERGRKFKKKSAWRKLARHFAISIDADPADTTFTRFDGGWLATARAVAVAPWGQRFTDVGACGSDEEVGRRRITMADAIATAMTRAINRAISNLIAMGEVSAEELSDRTSQADVVPDPEPTSQTPWPYEGAMKGKVLAEWPEKVLTWFVEPGRQLGRHTEIWQALAKDELDRRSKMPEGAAQ